MRIEIGPRDMAANSLMLARRDQHHRDQELVSIEDISDRVPSILSEIQHNYFQKALDFRKQHTVTNIHDFEALAAFFTPKNPDKPEIHGGFVKAKWCGDPETEKLLEPLKLTIRCIPLEQSGTEGVCVITGRPATTDAIFAKAY